MHGENRNSNEATENQKNDIIDTKTTTIVSLNDIKTKYEEEKYTGNEDDAMYEHDKRTDWKQSLKQFKWIIFSAIVFFIQVSIMTLISMDVANDQNGILLALISATGIIYILNCVIGAIRVSRDEFGTYFKDFRRRDLILIIITNHPYFVWDLKSHHYVDPQEMIKAAWDIVPFICQV